MQEIPIYLFTGFMDSGKTTLIKETLLENGFADQGKSLIICCEDGEVEYDEAELKKINASLVMVENEEDFTADFLNAINMKYLPDQVFIEYNGTWGMDTLTETELPRGWMVVQSLATVDATTFDMYLANMRTMIMEQLFQADVVIFNRCDDSTDKGKYRRNVKALNRKAQLVYERADGSLDEREGSCRLTSREMNWRLQMRIMQSGIWTAWTTRRNTRGRKSAFWRLYTILTSSRRAFLFRDVLR